jgi:hypothetical protein
MFKTGKGIHLGLSLDSLFALLGKQHCKTVQAKNKVTVTYSIAVPPKEALLGSREETFLDFYNMPSYYGKYIFKDGKLVEFDFGFEYP